MYPYSPLPPWTGCGLGMQERQYKVTLGFVKRDLLDGNCTWRERKLKVDAGFT